jgi:ketosteroid isomerase-like protein
MSQENVEIVRAALEAWHPNDSEEFARNLDPEFEYHVIYGPERGVYRGWKATVDIFDQWQAVFSDFHWEPVEYIDGGDDYVIVPFVEGGLGGASGVQTAQRRTFLCAMREGRILRLTEYPTTSEALEAAGLRE